MSALAGARVVVTGAGGFVGAALVPALEARGCRVECWTRAGGFDLDRPAPEEWRRRLAGVDLVYHLAARVHRQREEGGAAAVEARYLRTNAAGTEALGIAARAAGVGRLVFLSSAKVFGEGQPEPYRIDSPPAPEDAYARSKLAAEQALLALAAAGGPAVAVVRPPLVYGPGVGANFLRLQRMAALPLPLPLASLTRRRSLVSLFNLVDLLLFCGAGPAGEGVLLCADARAYTLGELVAALREARGRPPRLFPSPPALVEGSARALLGVGAARRLFGAFELDLADSLRRGWSPPLGLADTLARMAAEAGRG